MPGFGDEMDNIDTVVRGFSPGKKISYFNKKIIKSPGNDVEGIFPANDASKDREWPTFFLSLTGVDLPWPDKQASTWFPVDGLERHRIIEDKAFNSVVGLNSCALNKLKNSYPWYFLITGV